MISMLASYVLSRTLVPTLVRYLLVHEKHSAEGYQVWGGPPRIGKPDGSVVPCAAGGSLAFLKDECMEVLRTIRERYPKAWGKYGFVDAFNPLTG